MARAFVVLVLTCAGLFEASAQPVDPGLIAHERVRQQQAQGLVAPPPVTVITPAQPRVDAGALYHQQVVKQQAHGKTYQPTTVKPQ